MSTRNIKQKSLRVFVSIILINKIKKKYHTRKKYLKKKKKKKKTKSN